MINPDLLTSAERIQHEDYIRREETNAAILDLSKNGLPIKRPLWPSCEEREPCSSRIFDGRVTQVICMFTDMLV